ncbi:hypothetical protein EST38_g7396 [Candolleomyces aberdarensis]|uniref:Uncharacterized protein n=1 Tax=Candolleomyces aberdarensis TaxID=2316362 RepID=A0A4Q2DHF9_9AGAR|nr:hypothetical protein EST38_g7396 [Candolleomyces aberdarensis]
MPSKASIRRQKAARAGHRHRVQVQNATDALNSPTRRVASPKQPVAGPSSRSNGSALISPLDRRAFLPSPTFVNPFSTARGTPTPSLMDLDGQSDHSGVSTVGNRMLVTPDLADPQDGDHSDGSSTVVPMDFDHHYPQRPENPYFVTAVDLDNLRNAIHFMHHATVLVAATLDTMKAQNPHCPYLRRD